jgi:hypothetical protein
LSRWDHWWKYLFTYSHMNFSSEASLCLLVFFLLLFGFADVLQILCWVWSFLLSLPLSQHGFSYCPAGDGVHILRHAPSHEHIKVKHSMYFSFQHLYHHHSIAQKTGICPLPSPAITNVLLTGQYFIFLRGCYRALQSISSGPSSLQLSWFSPSACVTRILATES